MSFRPAKPLVAALLFCTSSCSSSIQAPDRFFTTFWTDVACPDGGAEVPATSPAWLDQAETALRCSAMVVEIRREWAPLGVDRFYEIVNEGFFNNRWVHSPHPHPHPHRAPIICECVIKNEPGSVGAEPSSFPSRDHPSIPYAPPAGRSAPYRVTAGRGCLFSSFD